MITRYTGKIADLYVRISAWSSVAFLFIMIGSIAIGYMTDMVVGFVVWIASLVLLLISTIIWWTVGVIYYSFKKE